MLYNKSTATRFAYVFLLLAANSAKSCKKPTKNRYLQEPHKAMINFSNYMSLRKI